MRMDIIIHMYVNYKRDSVCYDVTYRSMGLVTCVFGFKGHSHEDPQKIHFTSISLEVKLINNHLKKDFINIINENMEATFNITRNS